MQILDKYGFVQVKDSTTGKPMTTLPVNVTTTYGTVGTGTEGGYKYTYCSANSIPSSGYVDNVIITITNK